MPNAITKKYWKGLEELNETPDEELPLPLLPLSLISSTRRDFLKILGFSFGGAALAACSRMPVEKAIPYLVKPEEVTPGVANWYATTCAGCTAACPILVKVRDGRPIKIEGNSESPLTGGGLCAVGQATLLNLYDETRLKGPLWEGKETSWEEIDGKIREELSSIAKDSGKIVLLTGPIVSPTTQTLIDEWKKFFPGARHVVYDPVSLSAIPLASEKSFGEKVLPHYRFDRAKVVVGLSCDFLGTWISPVEFARGYAKNRKPPTVSRHIQFESRMSLTGSNADLRITVAPSEEGAIVLTLLREVSRLADAPFSATVPPLSTDPATIRSVAEDLWKARGQSLVVCGTNDVAIQTAVHALNALLGNIGYTVDLDNPSFQKQILEETLESLIEEIKAGQIQALLLYGVNPAYDSPDASAFVEGLKKIRLSVSFSDRVDETSSHVRAICPDHHFLESWNDSLPISGYYSLTQPVIRPLFNTRSAQESLLKWMDQTKDYSTYLREKVSKNFLGLATTWERVVHDGVLSLSQKTPKEHPFKGSIPSLGPTRKIPTDSVFEFALYEKIALRDGRHANNPWLQELPDPVTKITWDNYVQMAPSTAKSLGLAEGDVVRLKAKGKDIEIPVQIQPGQYPGALSVAIGYGRTHCGKAGNDVGINAFPFIKLAEVALEKTGKKVELAATQTHHSMEARPIVKETTLEEFFKNPSAGNESHEKLATLWAERPKEGPQWGMAIDLTACIGCSACILGCQVENNVPVVGKDEVRRRREMHWIRIDRYYSGEETKEETVHMPMMCQHCNHAPCETVCPVLATVHSTDGLNQQVYNRCVGTRYCANNCPYKVRRFNWFDYAHNDRFDFNMNNELGTMVLNPDIVVRSRGVMEKCSLCIQRIQEGKLQAKREGRPLKDGEIRLACEQSCPTEAIVFGDLNDPESRIGKLKKDGRYYHVLEELNVQPNVGYLTKVRNKKEGVS